MAQMSEERWRQFLIEKPRTAKLATTRKDGSPHVAPIWVDLDDQGRIVFNTGKGSVKGRTILRDPRVCICVDEDQPPFDFVIIDGVARYPRTPKSCSTGPSG
jgi:PPOX class probable F420-dependent enzyme